MSTYSVILAAAGKSSRFRDPNYKKPFAMLKRKAIWLHSAELFLKRKDVRQVIIVIASEDKEDFLLRKGRAEDALQLWELANNREVRNNSFNSDPISYDQHLKWLNKKLASKSSLIYVLDVSVVLIAQIRYDKKDGVAEIDYAVTPGFRGKSIGRKILQMTWKRACRELGVELVRGIVKTDNKASIFSFVKAGFEKVRADNYAGHDCLVYEKN